MPETVFVAPQQRRMRKDKESSAASRRDKAFWHMDGLAPVHLDRQSSDLHPIDFDGSQTALTNVPCLCLRIYM